MSTEHLVRFSLENYFEGNINLLKEVFNNSKTEIFFDIDGILFNTPEIVLKKFSEENPGIPTDPSKINAWGYLTGLAKEYKLSKDKIATAEDFWYDPKVLLSAQRYAFIKPVVRHTLKKFGSGRNFVLTSREPELRDSTLASFKRDFPEIKQENILIRKDKNEKPTEFKVREIKKRSIKAPWVVLVEDSTKYCKAVLDENIQNCLVINVPLGIIKPDFENPNLLVFRRYPEKCQGMYPLFEAINLTTG